MGVDAVARAWERAWAWAVALRGGRGGDCGRGRSCMFVGVLLSFSTSGIFKYQSKYKKIHKGNERYEVAAAFILVLRD